MPTYSYKSVDSKGKLSIGRLEAESSDALGHLLTKQGLFLMEAKLERSAAAMPAFERVSSQPVSPSIEKPLKRIPLDSLVLFTSELTMMLRTALPVTEALSTLAQQQLHSSFKQVLTQLHRDVQEGQTLSKSFERFPRVFDSIYLALLRAGEASGTLPQMLERLTSYLQFRREMRAKVRSALIYPAIIVLAGVGVVLFLITFILPTFATIFKQMNMPLPLPTRALLGFGDHIRCWFWAYALLAGGLVWCFRRWVADPINFAKVERAELRIPIVGSVVRNMAMTRILRTLGALVSSGVPILESLRLSGEAASNTVFRKIMDRVRESAAEGKGLATVLSTEHYFPPSAAHMIANAELTGTLPEVMSQISLYYEQETDMSIRNVFAVLEPLFIIVIGLAVALVAISILWPMFKMDGGMAP